MATIILVIVGVILFLVGVISPYRAGKIQRKTDKEAAWLKRMSNWFWDPIAWWSKKTIEFTRKALNKIAGWGKKTRRKL